MIKRFFTIGCILLLLWSAETAGASKVVAIVNGYKITQKDLMIEVQKILPFTYFHRNIKGKRLEKLKRKALRRLIEKVLIVQDGQTRVKVSEDEVKRRFEKIKKRFRTKRQFEKALKEASETEQTLKDRIRKEIIYEKTMKLMVFDRARVTEQQAKQYYESHKSSFHEPERFRLKEIFIKVPASATEEERQKKKQLAEEIYHRLKNGEDFEDLVWQYSEDRYKYVSGRLKEIHKGRLIPQVQEVIDRTAEGEITPPIETIYGYYIFLVEKKLPGRQLSFDQIKNKLIKKLTETKMKKLKKQYINSLIKKADIKILLKGYEDVLSEG